MPDVVNKVVAHHYGWTNSETSYDFFGGLTTTHSSDRGTSLLGFAHREGVQNPRYKAQIRDGQNATTSLSGEDYDVTANRFDISDSIHYSSNGLPQDIHYLDASSSGYLRYPFLPSQVALSASDETKATNRCIQDFIQACDQAQSSFEAGQDLGEYRETLKSIRRPLDSLRSHIMDYFTALEKRRRLIRVAKNLPKVLADTYLEWRFGINPLVNDVASAIADAGRFRFPVIPVKGHGHVTYFGTSFPIGVSVGNTVGSYGQNVRGTAHFSVRYKGAIRSNSDSSGKVGYAQSLQLLPKDWVPTLWDLLPYSWIADYFVNIGEILKGLCFVTSDLVWACRTSELKTVIEYSDIYLTNPLAVPSPFHVDHQDYAASGGSATMRYRKVSRSSLQASDLIPKVRFTAAVFTSVFPSLNIDALMISRGRAVSKLLSKEIF